MAIILNFMSSFLTKENDFHGKFERIAQQTGKKVGDIKKK